MNAHEGFSWAGALRKPLCACTAKAVEHTTDMQGLVRVSKLQLRSLREGSRCRFCWELCVEFAQGSNHAIRTEK